MLGAGQESIKRASNVMVLAESSCAAFTRDSLCCRWVTPLSLLSTLRKVCRTLCVLLLTGPAAERGYSGLMARLPGLPSVLMSLGMLRLLGSPAAEG